MAEKKKKLTKAGLLKEMDMVLQDLNLLRSALQADASRKQEDLDTYEKQFSEVLKRSKK